MKVKFTITASLFFHLLFQSGIAQNNDLQFKLVEGINGRPLGKINAITQDPYGYMWFAGKTESCIYRYDGIRITAFRHEEANPNSLAFGYPETIYADQNGMIWIGGNGLDQYDPATGIFKHYSHSENDSGSLGGFVFVILKDHRGRIWVGTNKGLDLLDEKTGKFLHYRNTPGDPKSLSNNIVWKIYEDHSGVLWVGTGFPWGPDEGGLNRLNPDGTFTHYLHDPNDPHSLINNKISSIFEDSRGILWVGTSGYGLHTMDRSTGNFERILYDPANPDKLSKPPIKSGADHIIFIKEDNTGVIWIGTFNAGVNRYDPATKKITHYQISNEAADSTCWTGFISQDGVLWVATEDSHLLYRVEPFHKFISSISTVSTASSFVEDKQGNLWVGTYGDGLFEYDQNKNLKKQFKHELSDSFSLPHDDVVLFQNHNDTIWVRTHKGLRILNEGTQKFTWFAGVGNLKDSIGPGISKIIRDKEGFMWYGIWGDGLVRYNPQDNSFKHFRVDAKDSSSLASNDVNIIYEDMKGLLWVGVGGSGGLNRLDRETGRFKHYMPGNFINSLYEDSKGMFWAGTQNGLFRYDQKMDLFSLFLDPKAEISTGETGAITEDNEKKLWFASHAGIVKLNPDTRETFIYANKFGVDPSSLQLWSHTYKNKKGEIFFPHDKGFYIVSPGELAINTKFQIILTSLSINNLQVFTGNGSPLQKPVEEISDLDLKHNQNNIAFNFAATDYNKPEATRYFTMLENYDNTWREVVGEKSSYYFNIAPGTYVYRVKAFNSDGTKAEKTISIHINPPWWQTWWAYILYAILLILSVWGFISMRTKSLQKEKIILEEKVAERTRQLKEEKEIVESTLSELKNTQAQLIQAEKMASLGELTAGIAHEIQNPLNFVNNFSEVNGELIKELKNEVIKGNMDEVSALANDIESNSEKINHHGKRADAIVKGMLQHSSAGTGIKEPTDINKLADEYLRLTYHGLRAKDKSFNATLKTDFDPAIEKVNIIPQDIGRVLLNLINNAFYAVAEKKKQRAGDYVPAVSVSTRKVAGKIEISVHDNGNGIPAKVLDKIFQPFFTTKPTGEGTGLGLSLSYDIIKAHRGELKVATQEGVGTEFRIVLPA